MHFEMQDLLRIPVSLLNTLTITIFFSGFLERKYKSGISYFVIYAIYFIVNSAISIVITEFATILTVFVCLSFPILFYKGGIIQRLICGGLIVAYSIVSECFTLAATSYSTHNTVLDIRLDATTYYIGAYISAILSLCLVIILVKRHSAKISTLPNKYYIALLLVIWICAGIAIADLQILEQSGRPATLAYLLSEAAVAVLSVLVFTVFKSYQKHAEQREYSVLLERQIKQDEQRYKLIDEQHREIATIKHDMVNHLTSLGRLISDERYAEVKDYLSEYYEQTSQVLARSITGKPSVDALIAEKLAIAECENIPLTIETGKLSEVKISPYHLNIILSNAIDNAIEACRILPDGCSPYILLGLKTEGDNLCVRVKNPSAVPIFSTNGLPVTSKIDNDRHGLGLSSIKRVTEYYNGTILCEYKNNEFTLYVQVINEPID